MTRAGAAGVGLVLGSILGIFVGVVATKHVTDPSLDFCMTEWKKTTEGLGECVDLMDATRDSFEEGCGYVDEP